MKTDFLKNLGITEQSVIDQILAENGRDVNAVRTELTSVKQQLTDAQGQISTKDSEIATLQSKVGDVDALNQQIAQLTTDKTNLTNELNTKVTEIKKDHAIEGKIRDAKGKNIKAIKALLDMGKITYENEELGGLDDQLEVLKGAEDSSMLFGEVGTPSGTAPSNPPGGGSTPPASKSFAEAVAKALTPTKNN